MITEKQAFGQAGSVTLAAADAALTGNYFCIQCITTTVFAVLTDASEVSGGSSSIAPTYPAGFTLFGDFTNIDLTSGNVRVYKTARLSE